MFELQLHLFLLLYNQSIKIRPIADLEERPLSQTHTCTLSSSIADKGGTNWLRGVRSFGCVSMWEGPPRCRLRCLRLCKMASNGRPPWFVPPHKNFMTTRLDVYDVESCFSAVLIAARILGFGGDLKASAAAAAHWVRSRRLDIVSLLALG